MSQWRALSAEAAGTFLLVLVGPGAIMVNQRAGGSLGRVGVSAAFGLGVFAAVLLFGRVSGAHINPAVSVALAATGRFPRAQVPGYALAQCAGAVAAAFTLRLLLGNVANVGATLPAVPLSMAIAIEFALSLVLMAAVLASGSLDRVAQAVMIGAVVGLCAFLGGPATGASMNPARSLGPAIASGVSHHLWIYWLAPIGGMLATALLHSSLRRTA